MLSRISLLSWNMCEGGRQAVVTGGGAACVADTFASLGASVKWE
jgi:hypothetical protein